MSKEFDPKEVSIIFAGHTIQGYADGTFALWSQRKDSSAITVGADGEGVEVYSNDKSADLNITLLQSSLSNDFLSAAHNSRLRGPCLIKDNNGTTLGAAPIASVKRNSDVEFSNENTDREWSIQSAAWDMLVGGIPNP